MADSEDGREDLGGELEDGLQAVALGMEGAHTLDVFVPKRDLGELMLGREPTEVRSVHLRECQQHGVLCFDGRRLVHVRDIQQLLVIVFDDLTQTVVVLLCGLAQTISVLRSSVVDPEADEGGVRVSNTAGVAWRGLLGSLRVSFGRWWCWCWGTLTAISISMVVVRVQGTIRFPDPGTKRFPDPGTKSGPRCNLLRTSPDPKQKSLESTEC